MSKASFKTVNASVRPSRLAVLVNARDPHWVCTARRIIEVFSTIWGGSYNLIIPTDGLSIHAYFWDLLEAFDPDYVTRYDKTGLDFKLADPEQYKRKLTDELTKLHGRGPHTPEQIAEVDEAISEAVEPFRVDRRLEAELKQRLAPFHYGDNILYQVPVSSRSKPSFPLTDLLTVLPHGPSPKILTLIEAPSSGIV